MEDNSNTNSSMKNVLLTGANRGLGLGLVDRCCHADQVLSEALSVAESYAENPDPQLRMIKALLTANGTGVDLDQVQRSELDALHQAYATPEHHEAVAAFMEKRPANFR